MIESIFRRGKVIASLAKRSLVVVFIVAYFGMTCWCLYRQALGDNGTGPLETLFTWDMYPRYHEFEIRRSAIGLTKSGKFLYLLPGQGQQYRSGLFRDVWRLDYLPSVDRPVSRDFVRKAVEQALATQADAFRDDPFTRVLLVESYWPCSFNLPDEWFAAEYGRENPHRKSLRLVGQAVVQKDGRLNWGASR